MDSVTVDSVWNSDSTVTDSAGDTLFQRHSRDLYLSFMPRGEGMAQCAASISIDSGIAWSQPVDSEAVPDTGTIIDTQTVADTGFFGDSLLVLDSGLTSLVPCGTTGRVKLRVLGQDRPNVAFRVTAQQWQPLLAGNPKKVTVGVTAVPAPGSAAAITLQCALDNAAQGLGYSTVTMVWWDFFGDGTWDDSGPALSTAWQTMVPPGAAGQQRAVIAKARDANGLWSVPCTLTVQFGMTSRLLAMVAIPAGTFQMGCTLPAAPSLSLPSSGAVNVAVAPTLSWSTGAPATAYRLQVAHDSSFATVIDTVIGGTSIAMPLLSLDSTYYWRVCGVDPYGKGPWGGVWSFTVTATGKTGAPPNFRTTTFDSSNNGFNASPQHSVTLGAFTMSATLVTQGQYQAVMDTNPAYFRGSSTALSPVEEVSWYDAALFCNALSKSTGLDTVYEYNGVIDSTVVIDSTKNGFRLPTEAEYEYAYRAGTTTDYYWGRDYPPTTPADTLAIDSNAVWYYNSPNGPAPVATKKPNAWGLYDMSGNIWEWCNDWYGGYGGGSQTNPTGPLSGSYRVLRGGSWYGYGVADDLSAEYRVGNNPRSRYDLYGFRVVCGAR